MTKPKEKPVYIKLCPVYYVDFNAKCLVHKKGWAHVPQSRKKSTSNNNTQKKQ